MTGFGLRRAAAGVAIGLVLSLAGCPTKYDPYEMTIRFVVPQGQAPLEDLYSLEMEVEYDSGDHYTFYLQPVSAGNWQIEAVPPVDEGQLAVLRFRGMEVDPADGENVIEVANGVSERFELGHVHDVYVYFSERHELALVDGALGLKRTAPATVGLPGGGALVVGGGGGTTPGGEVVAGVERLEPGDEGRYRFTTVLSSYSRGNAVLHRVDQATSPHDETVLIIGGFDGEFTSGALRSTVDRFDPEVEAVETVFNLPEPLASTELTELNDGRLLLSGGWIQDGPDALQVNGRYMLVDPVAASAVGAGQMNSARFEHRAVELNNGSVLVCGGGDESGGRTTLDTCELWSPGGVSSAPSLQVAREGFAMVMLPGDPQGRVVAFGGRQEDDSGVVAVLDSAELYDPGTGDWTLLGERMVAPRAGIQEALLPDDRFLVCGGIDADGIGQADCEIFDPGVIAFAPHPTASIDGGRSGYGVATTDEGLVLIVGGDGAEPVKAYLYNP